VTATPPCRERKASALQRLAYYAGRKPCAPGIALPAATAGRMCADGIMRGRLK